jgi:hypothetical protein
MNFDPEVTIASALPDFKDPEGREPDDPGFSGVAFTIHQFTEGKRLKIRLALADVNARIRDLMTEKLDADALPEDKRSPVYARIVADMQELVDDKINPVWVRHLLLSVNGLTIRNVPATVDTLIESGPRELYQEIVSAVRKTAGLTEQAKGESELPTTSNEGAGGQTSNISAPIAENTATT